MSYSWDFYGHHIVETTIWIDEHAGVYRHVVIIDGEIVLSETNAHRWFNGEADLEDLPSCTDISLINIRG